MKEFEDINRISDFELAECVFLIYEKIEKEIRSSQKYINKVQRDNPTKVAYLNILRRKLNLLISINEVLPELIQRIKNQSISISEELWDQAICESKKVGTPGNFFILIKVEDYLTKKIYL